MAILMADAGSVLRRQEPFERLSVATLSIVNRGSVPADTSPQALLDLCDAMAQNVSLRGLKLACVPLSTPEVFDAFVDAAAPKLTKLSFFVCGLAPACEQALVRLLRSTTLTDLCIHERSGAPLIDAAAAPAVADALRANRTLTHLSLQCIKLWDDMDAASAILGALTAHSTLRILDLCLNIIWDNVDGADATVRKQAGTLLGALIAADACALKALDISSCGLGDAGMAPVLAALAKNTHLFCLMCGNNCMTRAFAHNRLLPAVKRNTSLMGLSAQSTDEFNTPVDCPWTREAEAFVARAAVAGRTAVQVAAPQPSSGKRRSHRGRRSPWR